MIILYINSRQLQFKKVCVLYCIYRSANIHIDMEINSSIQFAYNNDIKGTTVYIGYWSEFLMLKISMKEMLFKIIMEIVSFILYLSLNMLTSKLIDKQVG